MARILITGTNSFIGTNFLKFSKYREVEEISFRENSPESIDFSPFDTILHLAAIVHQSHKTEVNEYFRVNRDLTVRIAEQAKKAGVRHFIFLSTVKVYGKWTSCCKAWKEDSPCFPVDPYGASKYEAEIALKEFENQDFIVSVVRTPIVYGPGVGANIMKLIRLIDRVPFLPFRGVNNNRHYTYVENLVGYIDRIIDLRASGVFVAMDAKPLSTSELVKLISGFMGRHPLMFRLPDFVVNSGASVMPGIFDRLYHSFFLDNTKTRDVLNYNPPYSIEDGFSMMIAGYISEKKYRHYTDSKTDDHLIS
jgi:nucleoside-diphosphate-sugar epimerase